MCKLCEGRKNARDNNFPYETHFVHVTGADEMMAIAKCPDVTQEDIDTAAGAYGKMALGITDVPQGYFRSQARPSADAA